jgi:hypothetical protein
MSPPVISHSQKMPGIYAKMDTCNWSTFVPRRQ